MMFLYFEKQLRLLRHRLARILHSSHISYGAILMLHRVDVTNENGIWYNEHLKMSPDVLKDMTEYAKKRGCKFVSLEKMIRKHHLWEQPRRFITLTLDDGYRDNFLNGAAVFKRLNIPYCIYVCTKMVEGKMLYWWEILEWLITREEQVTVTLPNGTEKLFDCSSRLKKEQAFLDIREIILHLPQDRLLEQIQALFSRYDIDYTYGNDTLGLTWDQIQELTRDPFCTIGNHTFSHLAFTGCCDEEITKDILRAQESMKSKTSYEMRHFAFPFGEAAAVSQHDIDLVKGLGFQTSATTNDGFVCYGSDRMELPRIFVTEKNWKEVIDRIAENC